VVVADGVYPDDGQGGARFQGPAGISPEDTDRNGLERLVRYCAWPPLSQQLLGRLDDHLVYRLRKPTPDGRTELILTPLWLLDRLA